MNFSEEKFQQEIDYAAAVLLSREMLQAGVITTEEFARINRLQIDRHRPVFMQESRQN
jgi:hypothetical protein